MTLDTIDCRILALLQKEGRISNQLLAERVALSPSACLRRLRALEDGGVILGYQAVIDPARLGLGFEALVHVSLDQSQPGWHEAFVACLAQWPEVHEASIVTGASNYVLQVRTSDLAAFSNFVVDKLNRVHGVREICSHIVMRKVKAPGIAPAADPINQAGSNR
ncbi:Lrp/AsnC family transcriptional regulator [Bordetella avium]|uniref:Leucine-responsive regulatory protein n=1 Tax=Bordetella avium (strain 197N) TaxID=360910 RepID=Q2L0M0_BORA1|nr:Lrp/AsnC family transcriptional regulator [Bordetella avium]AZY47872.1 Lrp/AsnC family transcriptional regulator [Bordetella avium]AZY51244.1 Lrp/AsnC family transcriptional regulator [Bordetella avium]RIQ14901.1 Lrp/AsnC family transcriptional regulator [Bordetella avium]RIQ18608.1 Lrp/AsnC family transcriptional regulator [Bordetella avium]RIQ35356.1 Lrp/AsnC family transcriptional regulator [Bordetella avium]